MTFTDREVADPDRPLEETVWTAESLLLPTDAVSSLPAGVPTADAGVRGRHGRRSTPAATRGNGAATITDADVTFGPIATTRIAAATTASNQVGGATSWPSSQGTVPYTIDADVLTLTNGDDRPRAPRRRMTRRTIGVTAAVDSRRARVAAARSRGPAAPAAPARWRAPRAGGRLVARRGRRRGPARRRRSASSSVRPIDDGDDADRAAADADARPSTPSRSPSGPSPCAASPRRSARRS